jgi:hypothetical protein
LVDDLDGSGDASTVKFSIDRFSYEVDLTEQHRSELYDVLEPYMAAGRQAQTRPGGEPRRRGSRPRVDREQLQAIRVWARGQGHSVSDRGRIPRHVVDAYHAAAQAPVEESPVLPDAVEGSP